MYEVFNTTSATDEESDGIISLLQDEYIDFYIVERGTMTSGGIFVKDKNEYAKARKVVKKFYASRNRVKCNDEQAESNPLGKPLYMLAAIIILVLAGYFIKFFMIYI